MASKIIDGTGKGYTAKVDSENKLHVMAVSVTSEHHSNHFHQEGYHLVFQQTPTGADDCFLYLKNNSDDDLILEGITLRTDDNEQIEIKLGVDGTPVGGTATTPVNCYTDSGNSADGTFLVGDDITSLTDGSISERIYVGSSYTSSHYNFEQDIIVPKNKTLALYAVNGAIEIDGTIVFHYHSCEAT